MATVGLCAMLMTSALAVVAYLATLGLLFATMSAGYTALVALAAGQADRWLPRHRRIDRRQGRLIGTIYFALGARVASQER